MTEIGDGGEMRPAVEPDESLLRLTLAIVLRHRRLIVATTTLGVGVALVVAFASSRSWTSRATLLPQGRRGSSVATGIAAQLGISVAGGDASQSPQFFSDLARSRTILRSVAQDSAVSSEARGVSIGSAIGSRGDHEPARTEEAVDKLLRIVSATAVTRTNTVQLAVTAADPELARDILQSLIRQLDRHSVDMRQSQASQERRFAESRLQAAKAELAAAEAKVEDFLARNRDIRNSPEMQFQYQRLQRELTVRQQVVSMLTEAFEQSRLDEARDTPTLLQVEQADLPAEPDSRHLLRALSTGFFLALAMAVVLSFTIEALLPKSRRVTEGDFQTLVRELKLGVYRA